MDTMKKIADHLKNWNFNVCSVFLIDSQFMVDGAKFLSGTMSALSVMVNLELPHINILSKIDLISKSAKNQLDRYVCSLQFYLINKIIKGIGIFILTLIHCFEIRYEFNAIYQKNFHMTD